MKMLLVSNMFPSEKHPYYGTFVAEIYKGLRRYMSVDLAVIRKSSSLFKLFTYTRFIISVVIKVAKCSDCLIYVHYGTHSLLPFLFLPSSLYKNRLVINFHGSDLMPETKQGHFLSQMVRAVRSNAMAYVVPSYYFQRVLITSKFYNGSSVIISASGGVALGSDSLESEMKAAHNESINVGYLGRLEPSKGIHKFLEFCERSQLSVSSKVSFEIAGTGAEESLVKRFCRERHNVIYQGPLRKDKVGDFLSGLDFMLFLSTRDSESLGLVVPEAMSKGVVVIALKNGAMSEIISNGKNGYLIESYDVKVIDEIIASHLELDDEDLERFNYNIHSTSLQYSSDNVIKNLVKDLRDLIVK